MRCIQHSWWPLLYLNYAFSESNDLNVTYFHHEQSASMAADAYYRLS